MLNRGLISSRIVFCKNCVLPNCSKNGKPQKRGKINLVGRLQLSTERNKEEDNEGIVQLRILRVQVRAYLLNYVMQFRILSVQVRVYLLHSSWIVHVQVSFLAVQRQITIVVNSFTINHFQWINRDVSALNLP